MEPTDLHRKHADAKPRVSDWFRGKRHPKPDKHLSRSLWAACLGAVGYIVQHLRQVRHESDQRAVAGQSDQPSVARHVCTRNPHRTCNCDAGVCADDAATYRYARGPLRAVLLDEHDRVLAPKPNRLGNFNCPIDNRACSKDACPVWCGESGSTGATTDTHRSNATAAKHS